MIKAITKTSLLLLVFLSFSAQGQTCNVFYGNINDYDLHVCPGSVNTLNFLTTGFDPQGGTFTYQWYYNSDTTVACPVGSSTAGWTVLSGANSASYNVTANISRVYSCLVTPSASGCVPKWGDGCIRLMVMDTANAFFGKMDTLTQTICASGRPAKFQLDTLPTFPQGTITYEWFYKDGLWPAPTGSTAGWTSAGFNNTYFWPPDGLTTSRTYACRVTGCPGSKWAAGCRRVKVIDPASVNWGTANTTTDTVCAGSSVTIALQTQPSGPTYFNYALYNVDFNCYRSAPTSDSAVVTTIPTFPNLQAASYTLRLYSSGCGSKEYCFIKRTIAPIPSFGSLGIDLYRNICVDEPGQRVLSFLSSPQASNDQVQRTFTYQWYYKNGFVDEPAIDDPLTGWTAISGATQPTYLAPGSQSMRTYACYVTTPIVSGCPMPSSGWAEGAYWVGNGNVDVYGTIASGDETICTPNMSTVHFSQQPLGFPITPVPYPQLNSDYSTTVSWFYKSGYQQCPTGNDVGNWNGSNVFKDEDTLYTLNPILLTGAGSVTIAAYIIPADSANCEPRWASGCRHVTLNNPVNPGALNTYSIGICSGGDPPPISFTTLPTGGSGNYTYQWCYVQGSGNCPSTQFSINSDFNNIIPGATGTTYDPPAGITDSRIYYCLVKDAGSNCGMYAHPGCVYVNVNSFNPGKGTQTGFSNNIYKCYGEDPAPITLYQQPSGGNGFTYQWYYKNGVNNGLSNEGTSGWTVMPGETSPVLDLTTTPPVTRSYECFITPTPNTGCTGNTFTPGWAVGSTVYRIATNVSYGAIQNGTYTVCNQSPLPTISFTTLPLSNGFTFPNYQLQWYYKLGQVSAPFGSSTTGWTIIPGATSSSYTPLLQTGNATYACFVSPENGISSCFTSGWAVGAYSVSIASSPLLSAGILNNSSETVCFGSLPTSLSFSSYPTVSDGNITYNWYKKAGIVSAPTGNATTGWTFIQTTSVPLFAFTDSASENYTYACYVTVTGPASCPVGLWAQGCKQVTVSDSYFSSGILHYQNLSLCPNATPPQFYFDQLPQGTQSSFNYQWAYTDLSSGFDFTAPNNSSLNALQFYDITGATSSTYTPPYLVHRRAYVCYVTPAGTCANKKQAQNAVFIRVLPDSGLTSMPAMATSYQVVCSGGDPTVVSLNTSTPPLGNYQWYYKDGVNAGPLIGSNTTGWTLIAGATAVAYNPPAGLTANRTYACTIASNTCSTPYWVNTVHVAYMANLTQAGYGTIAPANQSFCSATADPGVLYFSTAPTNSNTFTYQWYYQAGLVAAPTGNSTAGWTIVSGATSPTYDPPMISANRTYACFVTPSLSGCTNPQAGWAVGSAQLAVNSVTPQGYFGKLASDTTFYCEFPGPLVFSRVPVSAANNGYSCGWYRKAGVVPSPTGTSTTGWTYMGSGTSYNLSSAPAGVYTYACLVNVGCSLPAQWAEGSYVILNTASQGMAGVLSATNESFNSCHQLQPITFSTLPQGLVLDNVRVEYNWYKKSGIATAPTTDPLSDWTYVTTTNVPSFDPPSGDYSCTYACYVSYFRDYTPCFNGAWAVGCKQVTIGTTTISYGSINNTTETICPGSVPGTISFTTLPSGYDNGFTYQWYKSSASISSCSTTDNSWVLIPGATSTSYSPPALYSPTKFACKVTPVYPPQSGCATQPAKFAANCHPVDVKGYTTFSPGSITTANVKICPGEDPPVINVQSGPSGANYTFTLQWYYRDAGLGAPQSGTTPSNAGWTLIPGATSSTYDPPAGQQTSLIYACYVTGTVVNCGITRGSWKNNIATVSVTTPIVFGYLSPLAQSFCSSGDPSSISFSSVPENSTSGYTYQWYYVDSIINCPTGNSTIGWTAISGATSSSYDPPAGLTNSRTYACFVTTVNTACSPASGWASNCRQVVIGAPFSYGTVNSTPETICVGGDPSTISFSTAPSTGGTYKWYYQDALVTAPTGADVTGWTLISGATSATYNPPSGLTTNRTYACFVTSLCGIGNWASGARQETVSNTINFGTIMSGTYNICKYGSTPAISFTTPPSGGSNAFTYKWYYKDGVNACPTGNVTTGWTFITGATSATYTATAQTTIRTYACYVTTAGTACTVQSGWAAGCFQISFINNPIPGVINATPQTVCYKGNPAPVSFSTPPSGGTFTYFWTSSSSPTCNSGVGNIPLNGETTSNTYDPPAGITGTTYYNCLVNINSDGFCPDIGVWAGCQPVNVVGQNLLVYMFADGETVCFGGDPAPMTMHASGGLTTYSYKWYYKDGLVFGPDVSDTTNQGWTYITTTTTPTYDPPTGIPNSRTFACKVNSYSTSCPGYILTKWADDAYWINVSAANSSFGTVNNTPQQYCNSGNPTAITFSSLPYGGSNISYQWYYKDGLQPTPVGNSTTGWTLISGAITSSYDPPAGLTASRTYACLVSVIGTACGSVSGWASQSVQVTITNNTTPTYGTVASAAESFCVSGNPSLISFSALPSGGNSNFMYQWFYQNGLVTCPTGSSVIGWTAISGATTSSYDPPAGLTASRTYACFVTDSSTGNCASTRAWATNCRQVTITAPPATNYGTLATASESFCNTGDPSAISFTTAPSGGNGSFTYQWYYQNGIVGCPSGSTVTGWTIISGATSSSYDPPAGLTASRTYACFVVDNAGNGCPATQAWATNCRQVTVTIPPAANYGTLATLSELFCVTANPSAIAFSTLPSGGNGSYGYQWYYQDGLVTCPTGSSTTGWTIISGATTSSYDPPAGLTNSRTYACLVTNLASGPCPATTAWAANCRQVTVTVPPTTNYGAVTNTPETFCSTGDPANITFATLPSGGNSNFTYQWYYQDGNVSCPSGSSVAGWTIINGATVSSYNPPAGLTVSRTYACFVTDLASGLCPSTQSWAGNCHPVIVTTLTPTNYGAVNPLTETFCASADPSAINFMTLPSGGTNYFTYQWYYQDGLVSCPTGTLVTGWNSISGANQNTYDPPAGLTNNRTYACFVVDSASGNCPVGRSWAGNCRQITVNPPPATTYGTLATLSESFCGNGNPAAITFATAPNGGNNNFTYQWYYQDGLVSCPTGTNTNGWTIISGANASSYDPPAGLANSRTYACFVSDSVNGICPTTVSWAGNCRQVTVIPANYGVFSQSTETICIYGDPSTITFATLPTGGGSVTYQWYFRNGLQACPSGNNTSAWVLIGGATASSYNPPSGLNQSRTYACLVTLGAGNGCSASTAWAGSCYAVTVTPQPNFGTLNPNTKRICKGGDPQPLTFSVMPSGANTYSYQWYYKNGMSLVCPSGISGTSGWTIIPGATASTYDPPAGLTLTRSYACRVTTAGTTNCSNGTAWATNCVVQTVVPPPTYGTLASGDETVCAGGNPAAISFSTVASGYGTVSYKWYYKDGVSSSCPTGSNVSGWTLISGATASSYDPPVGLTASRTYACLVTWSGTPCLSSQWASNCRKVTVITCREIEYVDFDNQMPEDTTTDGPAYISTGRLDENAPTLEQNMPNPFNENTSITCMLPKAYQSAYIRVTNVLGEEIMLKRLPSPGINKVEVDRGSLTPGIYFYSLYLDGKLFDTKRMVITN